MTQLQIPTAQETRINKPM